jgi:transcriptional regulator with XRE-family HTH domain
MMTTHNRRPPNDNEKRAAERVRKRWLNSKKELGLTQDRAAELLGWTQSTFNAYLNARIPMSLAATLKFSKLLNIPAIELAPEIVAQHNDDILDIEQINHSDLPPGAQADIKKILDTLPSLPVDEIRYIAQLVELRKQMIVSGKADNVIKPKGGPVKDAATQKPSRSGKKAG